MSRPLKPPMTPAEAEAYARNHVLRHGSVIAVRVVALVLDELDRARIRNRELANALRAAGGDVPPDLADIAEPPPTPVVAELIAEHVPVRGRDACLVPRCRCEASQLAEGGWRSVGD